MAVLTIWSDLRCPWSYVASVRLRRMRDHLNADTVLFNFRALPAELSEAGVQLQAEALREIVAAAQLEPTAFAAYQAPTWPHSYLLAFEAQRWGYSLGQEIGESFDFALRRGFFLHSHDISLRDELINIANSEQLPGNRLAEALDTGKFRSAVFADAAESAEHPIEGSPQVFLPDGSTHHNPGTTVAWIRGIPIVKGDHPSVYEELIEVASVEM